MPARASRRTQYVEGGAGGAVVHTDPAGGHEHPAPPGKETGCPLGPGVPAELARVGRWHVEHELAFDQQAGQMGMAQRQAMPLDGLQDPADAPSVTRPSSGSTGWPSLSTGRLAAGPGACSRSAARASLAGSASASSSHSSGDSAEADLSRIEGSDPASMRIVVTSLIWDICVDRP